MIRSWSERRSSGGDGGDGGGSCGGGGGGGGSGRALHHGPSSTYELSPSDLLQPGTPERDSIPTWIAGYDESAGKETAYLIWRLTSCQSTNVIDLDVNGVEDLVEFIHAFEFPLLEEWDIKQHIEARRGDYVSEKLRGEQAAQAAEDYRRSTAEAARDAAMEDAATDDDDDDGDAATDDDDDDGDDGLTSKPLPRGVSSYLLAYNDGESSKPLPPGSTTTTGQGGNSNEDWDAAEEELCRAGVSSRRARMGREAAEAMAEDENKKARLGDLEPAPGDLNIFK